MSDRLTPLPTAPAAIVKLQWSDLAPHFAALEAEVLTSDSIENWLRSWAEVADTASEISARLNVATTVNTADADAETALTKYLDETYPRVEEANQRLKEKFLAAALSPAGYETQARNLAAEARLFRAENLPLQVDEQKLGLEYDKIVGAQTVEWDGGKKTQAEMGAILRDQDRAKREAAWRASTQRWLADRSAINDLWAKFLDVRLPIAENAGLGQDYRAYIWQRYQRFDYSPADCEAFRDAIEAVVVPAATRLLDTRRQALGLDQLRPWDLEVETSAAPALQPFKTDEELNNGVEQIFAHVDPVLGDYFRTMRQEGLLDLSSRANKAPGGYCTSFGVAKRPFIFMNAVGLHDDVQTMLHEGGHAFHVFESAHLPLYGQTEVNIEFAEVASMAMELLASPYLEGSFYSKEEANRARKQHLTKCLKFWPYMAVVDGFQHWVYENPAAARDGSACDAAWLSLWNRFMPGVDWSGLEAECATGWHRKLHIHQIPFYYVEYGIAQLGAFQVYARAKQDRGTAVKDYRYGLSLGGTKPLPQLFQAAGVRLAFDRATLAGIVESIELELAELTD